MIFPLTHEFVYAYAMQGIAHESEHLDKDTVPSKGVSSMYDISFSEVLGCMTMRTFEHSQVKCTQYRLEKIFVIRCPKKIEAYSTKRVIK